MARWPTRGRGFRSVAVPLPPPIPWIWPQPGLWLKGRYDAMVETTIYQKLLPLWPLNGTSTFNLLLLLERFATTP
jgi:hypothetical protein